MRLLRSHDFEICRIDPSKPWEPIRASLGASLIVAIHGAGLSNLIFMRPGGQLLELRHGRDDVFFDAYRPLAKAMGIDYRRQLCEPASYVAEQRASVPGTRPTEFQSASNSHESHMVELRPAGDPLYELNDVDMVVDLDLLRENLREAPGA